MDTWSDGWRHPKKKKNLALRMVTIVCHPLILLRQHYPHLTIFFITTLSFWSSSYTRKIIFDCNRRLSFLNLSYSLMCPIDACKCWWCCGWFVIDGARLVPMSHNHYKWWWRQRGRRRLETIANSIYRRIVTSKRKQRNEREKTIQYANLGISVTRMAENAPSTNNRSLIGCVCVCVCV